MKTRTIALLTAIVLSALFVMGIGAYIKYEMLMPYGIAQDKSIIELPFLLLTDDALRYEIQLATEDDEATEPTTVPTTAPTTEATTAPTTEATTAPTTEATTAPTTEPTTEPNTEPTAESTTDPSKEQTTDPTTDDATSPSTEPHIHTFAASETVLPSCTLEGYTWYSCSCGSGYADSYVPATGHSYQDTVCLSTCVAEGYTLHMCSVCGDSYQDAWTGIVAHTYSTAVIEPTPEADGYTEYTCTVCGDSYRDHYTEYIPPYTGPEPELSETYPGYDFSYGAVSDEWYDDVLFIGESRTLGVREYHRSGNADYFCAIGMNVFNVQTNLCSDIGFEKQTLESVLSSKTYGKIFINLGINECGYPASTFISAYKELIALVQKYQPNAKIILQGIMMVSRNYSDASYFRPDHLSSRNELIRGLSDGTSIYYIDVNKYFNDPNGYLYGELTWDGCHLYGSYYVVWADWVSFAVGQLGI